MVQTPRLVSHLQLRCGSLSITTRVILLANEFDARNVLHGKKSLAAVNQICVIHEAMNGCKNLKIHQRIASKCKYVLINTFVVLFFHTFIKAFNK